MNTAYGVTVSIPAIWTLTGLICILVVAIVLLISAYKNIKFELEYWKELEESRCRQLDNKDVLIGDAANEVELAKAMLTNEVLAHQQTLNKLANIKAAAMDIINGNVDSEDSNHV